VVRLGEIGAIADVRLQPPYMRTGVALGLLASLVAATAKVVVVHAPEPPPERAGVHMAVVGREAEGSYHLGGKLPPSAITP
jgi:hypothetical protein